MLEQYLKQHLTRLDEEIQKLQDNIAVQTTKVEEAKASLNQLRGAHQAYSIERQRLTMGIKNNATQGGQTPNGAKTTQDTP